MTFHDACQWDRWQQAKHFNVKIQPDKSFAGVGGMKQSEADDVTMTQICFMTCYRYVA